MQKALLCIRNLMHRCREPRKREQDPQKPCRQEPGTRPREKMHPWAYSPPRSMRVAVQSPAQVRPAGTQRSGPRPGKHLRASLFCNTGNSLKILKVCGFTDLKTRSSHEVGVLMRPPSLADGSPAAPHAPQHPGMEMGLLPSLLPSSSSLSRACVGPQANPECSWLLALTVPSSARFD